MLLIINGHIKPIAGDDLENGCILADDKGKIVAIGKNITPPEGATVIDAQGRLVTPGCVEPHCHIGLRQTALRWEGSEINENSDPVTPQMRAIDGFDPINEFLSDAIRGGVTCGCAGPGSANVVGGTFTAMKFWGKRIDKMVIKEEVAMKCALGENPKSVYGQGQKKAPKTRMGSAAVLRELLFKAREYMTQKEAGKDPKFDIKLEAMLPVMRRQMPLKCHVHRADDIFTAIRIAKEFDLKLTLDHCTEGWLVAEELAQEPYPALIGPFWGPRSKPELKNKSHANAGILHKAGVKVAITTDAPVIPPEKLPFCAGLAVAEGLPYEAAWRAITLNPAEIVGIADRVGSLEVGKDADIVIWTADPLRKIGAQAYMTLVDGQVVYTAE